MQASGGPPVGTPLEVGAPVILVAELVVSPVVSVVIPSPGHPAHKWPDNRSDTLQQKEDSTMKCFTDSSSGVADQDLD